MFGVGVIEVLVMLGLLVLAVSVVIGLVLRATRPDATVTPEIADARRHQVWVSFLAVLAAVVALPIGVAFTRTLSDSGVLPIMPSLMVAAACVVLAVGEATFPRPSGSVRSTVLNERSLSSVVPRGWLRAAIAFAVLDALVFVAGTLAATDGTTIRWTHDGGTHTASPFPGSSYVVPQLVALVVAAALTWLVCRGATTRPTLASDLEADAVLRRASGARAVKWLCWGLVATAAGDLVVAGSAIGSVAPSAWAPLGAVASIVGGVLVVVAVVLPAVPGPRVAGGTRGGSRRLPSAGVSGG